MSKNKGFTLIELLVVVLIIGILAAIALPMYTKTVEKSRMSDGLLNNKAIMDAGQRYILEHGFVVNNTEKFFEAADIQLGGIVEISDDGNYLYSKNFRYYVDMGSDEFYVEIARQNGPDAQEIYNFNTHIFPSAAAAQESWGTSTKEDGSPVEIEGNIVKECWSQNKTGDSICSALKASGFNQMNKN